MSKKNKERLHVTIVFILTIATISYANLSSKFLPDVKLAALSSGLGVLLGSLLYYFDKEDKR